MKSVFARAPTALCGLLMAGAAQAQLGPQGAGQVMAQPAAPAAASTSSSPPTGRPRAETSLDLLTRRASCLIEANRVIKLAVATQGTIAKMAIERGDRVEAGEVIAQLESDVEQAMLDAADLRATSDAPIKSRKAELALAAGKLERIRELMRRTVSSQQQLDVAVAEAEVATQNLEQAKFEREMAIVEARRMRATIERRLVRSPVAGVVTKVEQRIGEFADPVRHLAEIAENHILRVEVYLPVGAYPLVTPGMKAEIQVQDPIHLVRVAEVVAKDPQIDAASSLFQVSLRLDNQNRDIPAGLRCGIRFLEAPKP